MQIITGTEVELRQMIQNTTIQYCKTNDPIEKCALYNRIDNLCRILSAYHKDSKRVRVLSSVRNDIEQYEYVLDDYNEGFVNNFIENKKFHNAYLGDILDVANDELEIFLGTVESSDKGQFSSKDFYVVFHDFLETMNLEYLWDDFIKNKKLFSKSKMCRPAGHNFMGLVLHDPMNGDMSIVVDNFGYKVSDMGILAHEFGHVYDLDNLDKNGLCKTVTDYAYSSVLGESISMMFEKKLYEFLIKNNIMVNKSKDLYEDLLFNGKDRVFSAYILSLLDNNYLINDEYSSLKEDELLKLISGKFEDISALEVFLSYGVLALRNDLWYGYGDIMSLFLKDSFSSEGFNNELMRDFMVCRTKPFNPSFIENNNLDIKKYRKLYKQEVELCKK